MTSERKKYLIEIFLKKCSFQDMNKNNINFYFELYNNTYNVKKEKLEELKNKFNLDEYINRIIPIIDKVFSIEELKEIIKFYSSPTGSKLISRSFIDEAGKVGKNMINLY